nr:MAG TPA: baseplate protein [Caudoviricetes sp.]
MVFEDRVAKYPGRWTMVKSDGTSEIVTLIRNDEPTKEGTPINAATLNELSTVAGAINAKEEAVSAASSANSAATSAGQSAQSASADAKSAGSSAASAEESANRAAAIVSTDKTLSVEGAPADAKAVGDALKGVISADAVKTLIADALAKDHAKIKFWVSVDSTSPAALFGGSWEEIASERVLMGASSAHAAGTTVEAGLPNITGSFVANVYSGKNAVSGAVTASDQNATVGEDNNNFMSYSKIFKFSLDASRSNAIYGRSSTVQPAAYYVHIWHRVA